MPYFEHSPISPISTIPKKWRDSRATFRPQKHNGARPFYSFTIKTGLRIKYSEAKAVNVGYLSKSGKNRDYSDQKLLRQSYFFLLSEFIRDALKSKLRQCSYSVFEMANYIGVFFYLNTTTYKFLTFQFIYCATRRSRFA